MMLKWHLERDWDQDLRRAQRWSPAMLRPGPVSSKGAQGYHQPAGDRGTGGRSGLEDEWGVMDILGQPQIKWSNNIFMVIRTRKVY